MTAAALTWPIRAILRFRIKRLRGCALCCLDGFESLEKVEESGNYTI